MPKRHQTRDLPQDLREVLAENLVELMRKAGKKDGEIGTESGVGRMTISRVRRGTVSATIDTIQAIAKAFGIEHASAWILLMRGGASSMGKIFTKPVPDARLGKGWTRPDAPLLQSDRVKSSTKAQKIKSRA